jgi:hypothetical protein
MRIIQRRDLRYLIEREGREENQRPRSQRRKRKKKRKSDIEMDIRPK